ncbi:MAG: GDSL-type esterase/lipase family protein [Lentisphaeria bacterium]|nr:GDSL-type esterase/lipase family protein [Lentisphaeria bacterium]
MKTMALTAMVSMTVALGAAEEPAKMTVIGDWRIAVAAAGKRAEFTIEPVETVTVIAEKHGQLAVYDEKKPGYARGNKLRGVFAQECTARHMLIPETLVLRAGADEKSQVFVRGKDYDLTPDWGTFGCLPGGAIGEKQPVFCSYQYSLPRLDSVVFDAQGQLQLRRGVGHVANPVPPVLAAGERRLANVWLGGRMDKLGDAQLFPLLEQAYPEPPKQSPTVAEQLLPKTIAKLRSGEPIRILAWGDSVTVGTFVPNPDTERWQMQFLARLRERFPKAQIEMLTEAWGGRNTSSYLNEKPGSPKNYQEKVLDLKPDLIVSEFVNDAYMTEEQVMERYGKLLADFKGIGAEWIILTPHYVRPDWMGLDREKDIDEDPRRYVKGLRIFARQNNIALADGSLRYGRLWRQGIPYSTLMLNAINHPNAFGMKLFADALMELF